MSDVPFRKKLRIYLGDIVHNRKKLGPRSNGGIRALVYHSITDGLIKREWEENTTPKDLFARHMKYLADNKYNVISCKEAVEHLTKNRAIPPRAVVITFDDGYRDNYINAAPLLEKYNFHATIFLTTDFLRDYSGDKQYLSLSEIKDMQKCRLVDFGCHGLTHKALTMLGEKGLHKEIKVAKQKLEDALGKKMFLFAYPFGHSGSYNKKVINSLKEAGFVGAYTSIFGLNHPKINPFLLRRNRVSWLDELREFEKHLTGAYDWCALCEFFRRKRYRH